MHIENYLDAVCGQIKYKQAHTAIREELAEHIQELAETYLAQGETEETATQKALAQMGDAREIGQKLHQTHKPQTDWFVLGVIALLLSFSVFVLAGHQRYLSYNIAARQGIFAGIGLFIAAIFYFTNYTKLFKYSFLFYGVGVVFNLYGLLFMRSASPWWFSIGGFAIDSGALILFCYLIGLSGLAIHWQTERPSDSWLLIAAMALATGLLLGINFAKAFILAIVCLPLLHYSVSHAAWCTNPKKQLAIFYGILILFFIASILFLMATKPYIAERFTNFLHPEEDPMGGGYVPMQQRIIIKNTSWFQGLPEDIAIYKTETGAHFIVPEAHTDLIFIYVLARFGWGVAAALCLVMAALICKMFLISQKIQDSFGKTLCYGITAFFAAQIICNILMNLTLFPYSSISLPFISYGGSMLLLDMVLMAIFLNVYRRKNLIAPNSQTSAGKRLLPHIDIKVTWK